ncbi:MAG: PsiF repeat-containing protein [Nitrosomonadales bacterium]|nr:PsiF repeat-containing protein [Nitrosomonadales bacterium]
MKSLIALACFSIAFVVSAPAFSGEQQEKMKGCNKEAKEGGLKGDERKAFMSKCLKKDYQLKNAAADMNEASPGKSDEKPAASAQAPVKQQDKMKSCNADAKARDMKGEERKKFMSSCLKG